MQPKRQASTHLTKFCALALGSEAGSEPALAGTGGAHMLVALTMHADVGQKFLPGMGALKRILAFGENLHNVWLRYIPDVVFIDSGPFGENRQEGCPIVLRAQLWGFLGLK